MTAPVQSCQPMTDDALWELHKQPKDQICVHEYSFWFAGEPVVLANSMPGAADVLQSMVDTLNSHASLRAKVDELTAALRPDTIKKAIDAAFSEKGLWIDWQLRDAVVSKVVALTHSVNSQHSDGEAGR